MLGSVVVSALVTVVGNFLFGRFLQRQAARLRADVEGHLHRVKGEVERDLRQHEVRLRVEAEMRLRLLERTLTDVADYRSKFGEVMGRITRLVHEVEPNGAATDEARRLHAAVLDAFTALSAAGPFTPPDLRATATRVANGFKDCLRDVVSWGRLPTRPERTAACEKTDVAMRALADEWQSVFGGWIEKRMAEYEDSLRRIADGGASPLRAGPAEPPPRALNTGRPSV
jgi:hypothetical protein